MLRKLLNFVIVSGFLWATTAQAGELPDFSTVVEGQGAAVVNISTKQTIRSQKMFPGIPQGDPFLEFFRRFSPLTPQDQESKSLGSGFIISADGYVMTNAHVVSNADEITVRLTDKREFFAKVIGMDKRTDIALLKIDATGLPAVTTGDPSKLKVGQWVLAIGSPFGFDSSVTAGIVSAKGRSLPQDNFVPFIQTDVAINPGNSGGPLFNMDGEVVAINSHIYTRSGGSMGLSFAIPIDVATNIVEQLRNTGKVTRGRIGVMIQEVTKQLADSFGLSAPMGALISSVEPDAPADKVGIEISDVIIKFDGKPVSSSSELPRIVAATIPGSKVLVELWRKGASKVVTITVGEMPSDGNLASGISKSSDGSGKNVTRLGISVSELSKDQLSELQIKGGLVVDEVTGDAARSAGLHQGDLLLSVGNTPIRSVKQLSELIKRVPHGRNVALLIRRGDYTSYVAVKLDEK